VGVLERLSERTGRVLELARAEAGRLGHHHVGTEHLLLGLLAEGSSAAARTLVAAGATLDGARGKVAEAVGRNDGAPGATSPSTRPSGPRLERANRLSLQRRDEHLEPEHVLLSVIDVEGTAGQVLRVLGVDVVALRDAADLDVSHTGDEEPAPHRRRRPGRDGPTAPRCPDCRASLDGALAYRVLAAEGGSASRRVVVVYCAVCGSTLGAAPD